ncbi:hypothetical protein AMTRI_Chr06g195680 [Amborella trichopoda]
MAMPKIGPINSVQTLIFCNFLMTQQMEFDLENILFYHNYAKQKTLSTKGFDPENILLYHNYAKKKKDENGNTISHHPLSSSQTASIKDFEPESRPAIIFFNEKDLKVGNKFDLYNMVDKTLAATSPLAHQEVDSISFASVSLVDMLHRFSIPLDSPLAKKVARSLHMCVSPPQRSEHKFCATSLVPIHDFVSSILGPKAKPEVLAATLYIGENQILLRLTPPYMPVCHPISYPFTMFQCHAVAKTTVLMLKLEACHLDTSNRDPNNVSFKVLAITPGSEPVCHFFLESHLGFHFHFSRSGHVIMILTMLDNLNAIVVTCNCVSVFVTKAFRMSK